MTKQQNGCFFGTLYMLTFTCP